MKYILREYQEEAVRIGIDFLKGNEEKNAIEVLPTGSGKSLIIANIIMGLNAKTIVFQPSKEILEQNLDKIRSYGFYASVYSASMGQKEISNITLATIGSVVKNPDIFKEFKYIIIDECHFVNAKKGMYKEFLSALKGIKVLGLTATPYRLVTDGFGGSILKFLTRTRPRIFHEMIYYIQNQVLFNAGYLARIRYQIESGFDTKQIKTNSTGADYDDLSVKRYYEKINFKNRMIEMIRKIQEMKRKNLLVFTRFVEESEYLVANIQDSAIITGETPKKERERIIREFRIGRIKIVCNVGVLTTGFDYPELDTILLARPTMSMGLYYQMIGRGIRPHEKKDHLLVVDICGNFNQFGEVENFTIAGDKGLWYIRNKKRQLTNIYFYREGNQNECRQ